MSLAPRFCCASQVASAAEERLGELELRLAGGGAASGVEDRLAALESALKQVLLQMRNMAADWSGDLAALLDEKKMVSKEFKFASHADDFPARSCAPSQTQLSAQTATARPLSWLRSG